MGEQIRTFVVVGPTRGSITVVCDTGAGPFVESNTVYFVQAISRHEARWTAYRRAVENGDPWAKTLETEHPLTGVTIEDVTDVPEYGLETWPDNRKMIVDA